MIEVQFSGVESYLALVERTALPSARNLAVGLEREARDCLVDSQARVPYSSGYLHDSGDVSVPVVSGQTCEVRCGYTAPYAVRVHEDLSAHHPHGQAKFLESAVLERLGGMSLRLAYRTPDPLQ